PLAYEETLICTDCWYHLPYTGGHSDAGNPSARLLWGRVPLKGVASYLYLEDDSRVERILYHLKYRARPEIGELLGTRYGEMLFTTPPFSEAAVIIPVPLHRIKMRRRGYNQSASFASGLSQSMRKAVTADVLVRTKASESQTRMNRHERYENVRDAFKVQNQEAISGRHVLLVDDVLTTGATIEACAEALLNEGADKVSAVTIAKAV